MRFLFILVLIQIPFLIFGQNAICLDSYDYVREHYPLELPIRGDFYEDEEYFHIESNTNNVLLIVEPNSARTYLNRFDKTIKGIKLYLINDTDWDVGLLAVDGAVFIDRQVYYNEKWYRLKSYQPETRRNCGFNSGRSTGMLLNQVINFIAPCLQGDLLLQTRFAVYTRHGKVYSDTFEAYVSEEFIDFGKRITSK